MEKFTHPVKSKPKGDNVLTYSFETDDLFFAPFDGIVSKIVDDKCGKKVEITHMIEDKNLKSILCNVQNISVGKGDKVRKNQQIGQAFESGKLKFEVISDNKNVNPFKLIDTDYNEYRGRKKFSDSKSISDISQKIAELPLNLFKIPVNMITKPGGKRLKEEIDRIKSLL